MDETFQALRLFKTDAGQEARLVTLTNDDLGDGDVTVRIEWSTINYKDGLALTGKAPVVRTWPLTPGIDFAGVVEASENSNFTRGDRVVLNGWGVGESHHGGLSQRAKVKGDWLIKLPDGISTRQAMAIGTAGYTAMLAVLALEKNGADPERGDVLVTGAAGGVGSIAISLLARRSYKVIASSGRKSSQADYLEQLGAVDVIDRSELSSPGRPIGKERWSAAVDTVGSHTLANVLAQTSYGGVVAACGLAQGMDLPGSVAPFILRGVTLVGIDSVMRPVGDRQEAWARLAHDLDLSSLESMIVAAALPDCARLGEAIIAGEIRGRVVVDVNA